MFIKIYLKINNFLGRHMFNQKIYFVLGFLFLFFGFIFIVFLKINYLGPIINQIRGHEVSGFGLELINETYLFPLKLACILMGLILVSFGLFLKFDEYRKTLILSIKNIWNSLLKLKTWQIFLILLFVNLIFGCAVMFFVPEQKLNADGAFYVDIANSVLRGEGYTAHTISALSIAPANLPFSVFDIPPLYPLLLFVFFKIFGSSFLVAIFVNVILSAILPILVFLLAIELTRNKRMALLAGILTSVNYILIGLMTFQVARELLFTCLILACFVFLFKFSENNKKPIILVGLFLGLAFLARLEAFVLMLPVIILVLFFRSDFKKALVKIFLIVLISLVIISPWFFRNYNLSGNIFGFSSKLVATSFLTGYQDYDALVGNIDASETFFKPFAENPFKIIKITLSRLSRFIVKTPLELVGSIILFLLSVSGLYITRKEKRLWPLILFIAICYLFYPFLSGEVRHLQPVIPFLLIFASIGILAKADKINDNKKESFIYLFLLIFAFTTIFGIISATRLSINQGQSMTTAKAVSDILRQETADIKTIMYSGHTDFLHYYLSDKNVIAFPSKNMAALKKLIEAYDVNRIIFIRDKDIDDVVYSELDSLGAMLIHSSGLDPNTLIRIYEL
jgi:4-amino-4-deoxy-L-arabinose transferase-like glycosyltransferase